MPERNSTPTRPIAWAATGDVNAFFGLMLDNVADLLLMVSLLTGVFAFPTDVAIRYMIPGTAIGVMVGDLLFFWLALQLAKKTGRSDVTAMPLGVDTPSTFGMVFFVLGPAFVAAKNAGMEEHDAAIHTWHIGICSIFISGLFKLACSVGSGWVRKLFPRAGLLGSLTAVALVLISFLPLLEMLHLPLIGLVALAIILTTLIARVQLPFKIPGALGALLIAGGLYYLMRWLESAQLLPPLLAMPASHAEIDPQQALLPYEYLSAFRFQWFSAMRDALQYLPIVIPFALATVVGGIDCTESAAAAGDDYDTNSVIFIESLATIVASLFGGVIQTTPYIGHPAYKAMGGRAAYTLATALFVGSAGLIGYFGYLYVYIPKPTVFPILIFVGLEITAQSFRATPKRHYPSVALACVPALAALAMIYVDKLVPLGAKIAGTPMEAEVGTLRILANGFIVTSLLWSSALAALIDRKLFWGAAFFLAAAVCTAFGIIHSPAPGSPLFLPWDSPPPLTRSASEGEPAETSASPSPPAPDALPEKFLGFIPSPNFKTVVPYVTGYLAVGILLLIWGGYDHLVHLPQRRPAKKEEDDEDDAEEEVEEE